MESVCFDGLMLTDLYSVVSDRRPAQLNALSAEVEGRDGVVPRGMRYGCPQVSIRVVAVGDADALFEARRELTAAFSARDPRKLEFGNDGGLYYMAQPMSLEWTQHVGSASLDVQFLVPSPAMYGAVRTATVPSGGSVEIEVRGSYPTAPTIVAPSASRAGGDGSVWGLTLDEGAFVHVALSSVVSRRVEVDCGNAICKVSGAVSAITLDSDWFEFAPGAHVIRMDNGTGEATVTWQERWLA